MIVPSHSQPPTSATPADSPAKILLPGYGHLIRAALLSVAPLVALSLLGGRVWWAISLLAGCAISAAVGGVLHLLIGRAMGYFVASLRGPADAQANPASLLQFAALLLLKFVVIAGVAWAIVSVHSLNLLVVLAGFLVAHAAIIVTATRFLKRQSA